ncbi:E5, partial [Macaca fascicularis papillomavirus 7]
TATILGFILLFLLLFVAGIVVCAVIPSLLLCFSTYASVLLLMLLFWVTVLSSAEAFALCILCFLLPLFGVHLHATWVVWNRLNN